MNTSSRKPPLVAALDVPVSADIEAGYDDVAATVTAVLEAGAVGVNIEDRRDGSVLYEPAEQADRLAAARGSSRHPVLDQRSHRRVPGRHPPDR